MPNARSCLHDCHWIGDLPLGCWLARSQLKGRVTVANKWGGLLLEIDWGLPALARLLADVPVVECKSCGLYCKKKKNLITSELLVTYFSMIENANIFHLFIYFYSRFLTLKMVDFPELYSFINLVYFHDSNRKCQDYCHIRALINVFNLLFC